MKIFIKDFFSKCGQILKKLIRKIVPLTKEG